MKNLLSLILIITSLLVNAQRKVSLYKGTIDKLPVTFYLIVDLSQCTGDNYYTGMYKYDKMSNWLELNISEGKNNQFVMVEHKFTGLMIVKKELSTITGTWISSDNKRQLPLTVKKVNISKAEKEKYDKKYEEVAYSNNDC